MLASAMREPLLCCTKLGLTRVAWSKDIQDSLVSLCMAARVFISSPWLPWNLSRRLSLVVGAITDRVQDLLAMLAMLMPTMVMQTSVFLPLLRICITTLTVLGLPVLQLNATGGAVVSFRCWCAQLPWSILYRC